MSDQSQGPDWWQASDGKWYPPHPPVQSGKRRSGCMKWGLIAVVAFIALGVGCAALVSDSANEAAESIEERNADIEKDVEVLGCQHDETTGWMQAQIRITNNSSERSNYIVEIAFVSLDDATQYETGIAVVNGLDPGQVRQETVTTTEEAPDGGYKCHSSDVTRLSDES